MSGRSTISMRAARDGVPEAGRAGVHGEGAGPRREPEAEALVERALGGGEHGRWGPGAHRGGEVLGEQAAGQARGDGGWSGRRSR